MASELDIINQVMGTRPQARKQPKGPASRTRETVKSSKKHPPENPFAGNPNYNEDGTLKPEKERIWLSDKFRSDNELEAAKLLMQRDGKLPLANEGDPEIEMMDLLYTVINNAKFGVGGDYEDEEAELLRSVGLM